MSQVFCTQDMVAKKSDPTCLGTIERTHADVDTHEPYPERTDLEADAAIKCDKDISKAAFRQFKKDGIPPPNTVLVQWLDRAGRDLVLESTLDGVDRSLMIGDVVKRNSRDALSGIVVNTLTKCTLQPICDMEIVHESGSIAPVTGLPTRGDANSGHRSTIVKQAALIHDVPASEITSATSPDEEDIVIYKDWVGKIAEVDTMLTIRLPDNSVVEIKDDLADHVGATTDQLQVGNIATTTKSVLRTLGRWIYGKYNPNTLPIGTVVQARVISIEVDWLERRLGATGGSAQPHNVLERTELESADFHVYDRTKWPQAARSDNDLTTISHSEEELDPSIRYRFKDLAGACVKYDGLNGRDKLNRIDRRDTMGYDLNVFDIVKNQTEVTVQWQDLSITRHRSIELIPEGGVDDEHDAWPGEYAHLHDLEPLQDSPEIKQARKVGIVQQVDASDRMATVRWCPDACLQYSEDVDLEGNLELVTGVVGLAGSDQEEISLYDIETGELNVCRGDIVLIASGANEGDFNQAARNLEWLGEIVDTRLDGSLTVRLGAADPVRDVRLRREDVTVAISSRPDDEVIEWDDDEFEGMSVDSEGDLEMLDDSDVELISEAEESEGDEVDVRYEDENGDPMDADEVENEDWESESEGHVDTDVEMADQSYHTPPTSVSPTPPSSLIVNLKLDPTKGVLEHQSDSPEPYLILDSPVPESHGFSSSPETSNTAHIKRTQKEHRILSTPDNVPKGVYVRTWESRFDLLRVLFIGPEDTPYINAPFVIDLYLPHSFPAEPPKAFFHSWNVEGGLGGVGRVNPNLYEDGKICLSLIGTWDSGKGSEGWIPGRSTILQVIVSILGLVLVKEPYFNEAGYELLAALDSHRRASELYSERAYLKARTFILAALKSRHHDNSIGVKGTEGFEDVLSWLYQASEGPKLLEKCTHEIDMVLKNSEGGNAEGQRSHALTKVSKGACISLRRIQEKLKER